MSTVYERWILRLFTTQITKKSDVDILPFVLTREFSLTNHLLKSTLLRSFGHTTTLTSTIVSMKKVRLTLVWSSFQMDTTSHDDVTCTYGSSDTT